MASAYVHPSAAEHGASLRFDKLPPELRATLEEFDDGDGQLNVMELAQTVHSLRDSRSSSRRSRCLAITAVSVAVFMLSAVLALSFTAAKLANPAGVQDGKFVAAGTDQPLQVASTEFKMAADGSLKTHGGLTVATRPALKQFALSSLLPTTYFQEMQRLDMAFGADDAEGGDMISVAVTGCARVSHNATKFGSVVRLVTSVGMLTLDGFELHADAEAAAFLKGLGMDLEDHPSSPHGRRLAPRKNMNAKMNFSPGRGPQLEPPAKSSGYANKDALCSMCDEIVRVLNEHNHEREASEIQHGFASSVGTATYICHPCYNDVPTWEEWMETMKKHKQLWRKLNAMLTKTRLEPETDFNT